MDLRTTPEAGAAVLSALEPHRARIFAQARATGRREPPEAYAADALVALCASRPGTRSRPRAMVHVRVDHTALVRGHVQAGETCDIPWRGARSRHHGQIDAGRRRAQGPRDQRRRRGGRGPRGRTVTAHQRSALQQRDPECVVAGCHVGQHPEIDHVDGWAMTRVTTVDRLARLCGFHHHLKTYCGYRLVGRPGAWEWRPPEVEDHGSEPSRPPPGADESRALPLGGSG